MFCVDRTWKASQQLINSSFHMIRMDSNGVWQQIWHASVSNWFTICSVTIFFSGGESFECMLLQCCLKHTKSTDIFADECSVSQGIHGSLKSGRPLERRKFCIDLNSLMENSSGLPLTVSKMASKLKILGVEATLFCVLGRQSVISQWKLACYIILESSECLLFTMF